MNRMLSKSVLVVVVLVVVAVAGYFIMMGAQTPSVPDTSEEQAQDIVQDAEKDTKQVTPPTPKTTPAPPVANPVSETKTTEDTHPWSLKPFFLKSRTDLMHPSKEDWIAIGANGPDQSIDLAGWKVRSAVTGNTFTIPTVLSLTDPKYTMPIRIGSKDVAVFIHSVGFTTSNYFAEGEYHLYFLSETVAWRKDHDTIQLVNPAGEVIDTYSY